MEAIIFCGLQASGKSSFYKERFFRTHMRISMDMLNTRNKEQQFLEKCLQVHQRFVVDNTNPSKKDRARYIEMAKAVNYKCIGYYFQSKLEDCLARNAQREGKACIPERGVKATYHKLELPDWNEGWDELYYVSIQDGKFVIKAWKDEI